MTTDTAPHRDLSFAARLYRGQVSYDFIGHRRRWYIGSGIVILVSIISLAVRGLNPSIDFKGGAVFVFPTNGHSVSSVQAAMSDVGITDAVVQTLGTGQFRVQAPPQNNARVLTVENSIITHIGVPRSSISISAVGSSWGSQITNKAVEALIVFMIAVILFLSMRFEPKMALAAVIALIHDLVITAGIYSLSGFEVSPSTVIALLTILGYSLYDTVVVFDKVRENTVGLAGGSRMTFSQAANLAVNQTLVRSVNTSIIALLPVAGLLIIGAGLLGAGSLKDLALALFIGLSAGAYSSIFIATPLLTDMKEREPQYRQLARRVAARQVKEAAPAATAGRGTAPAVATAGTTTAVLEREDGDEPAATSPPSPPRPGARPAPPPRRRRGGGSSRSARKRRR